MSTFRRFAVVFTALGVLLGVGAVTASPAYAAWDNATPGLVCLWNLTGGTGAKNCYAGVSGFCTNINDVPNTHNSFWNRRGDDTPGTQADDKHVQFYDGRNCTGALVKAENNGYEGPFASGVRKDFWVFLDYNWRNRTESIFFNTG